jgi:hypothetical protein
VFESKAQDSLRNPYICVGSKEVGGIISSMVELERDRRELGWRKHHPVHRAGDMNDYTQNIVLEKN